MAQENNKENNKKEEKQTNKPKDNLKKQTKKQEAVVNARNLPLSKKHCMAICDFIRGKKIEKALELMQKANKMQIPIPMKGEIPHRKGKIMSGRYPINATEQFIKILKQLSANAINNDVDIDKARIECKADQASRPYRRFGSMKFKRTHITIKLTNKKKTKKTKKKN